MGARQLWDENSEVFLDDKKALQCSRTSLHRKLWYMGQALSECTPLSISHDFCFIFNRGILLHIPFERLVLLVYM